MTPETCPNCGADLPRRARACPDCGSCEQTGWSERAGHEGLGLPDEEFDYDQFVAEEFAPEKKRPRGVHPFWWFVAFGLLAALVLPLLWRLQR